jgi:hypothetical protein
MQAIEVQNGVRVRFDDSEETSDPDIFTGVIESSLDGWRIRIDRVEETAIGIARGEVWTLGDIVDEDDLNKITVIGGDYHYLH